MITIEYTGDYIENEPGPNLYWRGKPKDFHSLACKNGIAVCLNDLKIMKILDNYKVTAISSNGGDVLVSIKGNEIGINVDSSVWQRILHIFLEVSFYPGHDYVEFSDLNLQEAANFIISSEQ